MSKISNKRLKVIFLDAGGVLFDTFIKQNERITNVLIERGIQKSKIDAAIKKADIKIQGFHHNTLITTWYEERQYYLHYYGLIAKELGDEGLTDEIFYFAHYATHCELFPEVEEVLIELSNKYRLAVISNAMPSMDWIFDRLKIRKYFDAIILSAHVNASKPDEAIFNIALDHMGNDREECLFIDDIRDNIVGAERVGISAIHLDREKLNLLELLKSHKIV